MFIGAPLCVLGLGEQVDPEAGKAGPGGLLVRHRQVPRLQGIAHEGKESRGRGDPCTIDRRKFFLVGGGSRRLVNSVVKVTKGEGW